MFEYCLNFLVPERIKTLPVKVGEIWMGGTHPMVLQSMTTADTMDTDKTVAEAIRMIEAGCQLVRITAPSKKEAQNLQNIKDLLRSKGYNAPIVADIHFTPNAAEIAAKIVEKVRINPGNYADKKKFELLNYTPESYHQELHRIQQKFMPLLKILKEHQTALRIGTNHGSLSDRIMSFWGDSPAGMIESALEFVRFCEQEEFYNIVISMKSSNPQVMVQAYRLLAHKMLTGSTKFCYPLHLGVTEAGEGEDGRIKSAVGIGTLLSDGIGDTVRVSLTEPPEYEIPVADYIVKHYERQKHSLMQWMKQFPDYQKIPQPRTLPYDPFAYQKRTTDAVFTIGGNAVPRVITDVSHAPLTYTILQQAGYTYHSTTDKWTFSDQAADYLYFGPYMPNIDLPNSLYGIMDYEAWLAQASNPNIFPLFCSVEAFLKAEKKSAVLNFVELAVEEILFGEKIQLPDTAPVVGVLSCQTHAIQPIRYAIIKLIEQGIRIPLILKSYVEPQKDARQTEAACFQLEAACQTGIFFIDGLVEGLWLHASPDVPVHWLNSSAFSILQATRQRISKTEYISCPSCGRTLFDLQTTTAHIRKHTEHLKGVKIAVMGCIVNGPGEMADADYGYVGSGPGTVSLYRGKELIVRDVPENQAVQELINLIQQDGKWIEPQPHEYSV